ncbi:hypothetical protein AB6F04_001290 [Vibrio cyclitrophicus]
MNAKQLNYFPRLNTVLSEAYRNELTEILERGSGHFSKSVLSVYLAFVDIAVRRTSSPYSALDIRNSNKKLEEHYSLYVGFIYSQYNFSDSRTPYNYCLALKKAFRVIFAGSDVSIKDIKLKSRETLTDDVLSCISQYKSHCISNELVEYYSGWKCKSKEGKEIHLHLANVFDNFGSDFTESINVSLSNYARTLKSKTAVSAISLLIIILNVFAEICDNYEDLKYALKAENSTKFMLNVYHVLIAKTLQNANSVESFINEWKGHYIPHFTKCFIDAGLFEEPNTPLIVPNFKSPKSNTLTISIGGKFSSMEKERVFADIPLEIKDEEALSIIEKRLKCDLEHICISFQNVVDEIKLRHKRNLDHIADGEIKIFPSTGKAFPIGLKNYLDNTVATFHHYGYGGPCSNYATFLGEKSNTLQLIKELNIPTLNTLMAFASLLVIEHPKITPSWLQEWELFDKNGNQVGLKKAGKQWVAVSFKNRRGVNLAQQEVHLTGYSKRIVDGLIEHTKFTRDALKNAGDSNWRYVMLHANLTRPIRAEELNASIRKSNGFHKYLIFDSFNKSGELILTKDKAEELAPIVTLRNIRKSRGLQIYIETKSIKAVAEALGHKEATISTLNSYLPEPLMDYFNSRWVRIFQNAIMFEALKDSPYLIKALNFSEESLNEFLNNHRLGELPALLEKANNSIEVEENQNEIEQLDELVYTLSTPLFQVLIAIQNIVESSSNEEVFIPIIENWYEAAKFILSQFNLKNKAKTYRTPPLEAKQMYEDAINNPLNLKLFKENLLCQ